MPIAKPEDPINTKNKIVPIRQDTTLSTPKAAVQQQPEEQQVQTVEVTFNEKTAAVSVSNSRRQRSRRARGSGRTSEALSRDDQCMFMWEEEQYQRLFHSSKSGADSVAKIGLTLASGQRVKAGESVSRALIDSHLQLLREDLTHLQREVILRPPKPPSKKNRDLVTKETVPSSRKSKTRRRDLLRYDSDSDGDDHSVSLLSSASVTSKLSEASTKHSGRYATMTPDGSDTPMESPITLEDGLFIHRREHVNSARGSDSSAVVTNPDFFRTTRAKTDHTDVTMIDNRRPFIRKNHV